MPASTEVSPCCGRAGSASSLEAVLATGMERPQHQHEIGRRGLEQRRDIDVEGAESGAVFAKLRARRLVERLDLGGRRLAAQHAEIFRQLIGEPAGEARQVGGLAQHHERRELGAKLGVEPGFQPLQHPLAVRGREMLVGEKRDAAA